MMYFDLSDYLLAILSSLLCGVLFALAYGGAFIIAERIYDLLRIPKYAYRLSKNITRQKISALRFRQVRVDRVLVNIIDFFCFFIFGICLIISDYVYLDGTARALMPMLCFTSFYLFYKYAFKYIYTLAVRVIVIPLKIITVLLAVALAVALKILALLRGVGLAFINCVFRLFKSKKLQKRGQKAMANGDGREKRAEKQ